MALYAAAKNVTCFSLADVKAPFGNATIIDGDLVDFNIRGNRFRSILLFDYSQRNGFVRFAGTHAEFDRIDASRI